MAVINQNLEEVEVQQDITLLSSGWYDAIVADSRIDEKPKGLYVQFDFEIIGYPNHVFDGMSMGNDYGLIKLKTLASACLKRKVDILRDTEELHGKYVKIKVATKTDETGQYDPRNVVKAYKEYEVSDNIPNTENKKAPWEK